MINTYTYGFKFNGFIYGWIDSGYRDLYRLPVIKEKRFYPIKKPAKWIVNGEDKGYIIGRKRKSFAQLKEMTIFINQKHEEIKGSNMLF